MATLYLTFEGVIYFVPGKEGGYQFYPSFFQNQMMENCNMRMGTLVENVCQVNKVHLVNAHEFAQYLGSSPSLPNKLDLYMYEVSVAKILCLANICEI